MIVIVLTAINAFNMFDGSDGVSLTAGRGFAAFGTDDPVAFHQGGAADALLRPIVHPTGRQLLAAVPGLKPPYDRASGP